MPSDLQKTCFRIEWLQKITKTKSADKYKTIPTKLCTAQKKEVPFSGMFQLINIILG